MDSGQSDGKNHQNDLIRTIEIANRTIVRNKGEAQIYNSAIPIPVLFLMFNGRSIPCINCCSNFKRNTVVINGNSGKIGS